MKCLRCGAPSTRFRRQDGFALVISLSLMVLITVLAVGLLGLSSVSLRSSSRDSDLAVARANARMALSMAIAQLQKHSGPDTRVTMTGDQRSSGDGSDSSAAEESRHWTGVYDSWNSNAVTRPTPNFRSWMISGDPEEAVREELADSGAGDPTTRIQLVGKGTTGDDREGVVEVPSVRMAADTGATGADTGARLAWWAADQGVKAAMATPPPSVSEGLADVRAAMQAAPRNAVGLASAGSENPFAGLDLTDAKVSLVTGWQQSGFLAATPASAKPLFHDLAPFSSGLLVNLRSGGFRKDLSMRLELPASRANSLLAPPRYPALYQVGGESGINLHELWAYYNLHKELRTTGSHRYTTGGTLSSGTPHLMVESSPTACAADDEFHFKQPVITSYQMVLSFESRPDATTGRTLLRVVSDPIITFWNPLDVPVVIPTTSFFSIKYWQIPYDLMITVNGSTRRCPLLRSLSAGDSNYLSLVAGNQAGQLVFKPGEVIKVSQRGNMLVQSGANTNHTLQALPGFNIGGGVSYPVRDESGNTIELPANATIYYEARPNGYTAGATSSSGSVPPGYTGHTRHFSLNHHEVYVGYDRKSAGGSLGYGGMYIDYDFGNRRLKATDPLRGETQAGTKPSNQRLFANRFPQIFRPITRDMGRPLTSSQLAGTKSPFMIISYNAKTEASTDPASRSRYLGRFNPKVHHVDFYDLSQAERDLLPYEYTVDPLVSWKNRALETSPNGNAFFGGGMNAELGSSFVTTHSVPREPIVSLAALQHSFANGFEMQRPRDGYSTINGREPMLPQISHAIGNSVAPPIFSPSQTQGTLGGRPTADHSYLANLNLWDDWFFSGIAPQTARTFENTRTQRTVAEEFLNGTGQLPVVRYQPETNGEEPDALLSRLFSGVNPTEDAMELVASFIRVDGMFNVNSTSVEAWKAMLGGLKDRPVVVRSVDGRESISTSNDGGVPVAGLLSPVDQLADARSSGLKDEAQWIGRRALSDAEIEQLARAIVKEVRRRGPFLSLADFVNRRPGSDKDLARAGAIQCALDSGDVDINSAWQEGDRAVPSNVANRFAFPEAEEGASGYGMPGIVKQADILTPIAPVLSARSDSFLIRAYGESVDGEGRVLARAWCEATVQRDRQFVDGADAADLAIADLTSEANRVFGRRYVMSSFRWLHPDEV